MKYQLSNIADRATDAASTAKSFGQPAFKVLLVMMVLMPLFAGSAAAATGPGDVQAAESNPLCGGENQDSKFTNTLESLLTILIIAGPVIGTSMAAFAQVAASGSKDGSDWMSVRKKALISGWSVPVLIYAMDVLGNVILPAPGISCIIP